MLPMDAVQKRLIAEVADLHDVPMGAYNFRANSKAVGRHTTANIDIQSKKDGSGIDIFIKPNTKNESVHIPVVLSASGIKETVYNDFFIGEDCREPKAYGIFQTDDGDFVVYKNKADGVRAVRPGRYVVTVADCAPVPCALAAGRVAPVSFEIKIGA